MNSCRLILLVGAVALVVGVIGLLVPVSVPGPDNGSIGRGNGLVQDSSAAQQADHNNPANLPILNQVIPHTNYTAHCQSAVRVGGHGPFRLRSWAWWWPPARSSLAPARARGSRDR